MGGVRLGKPITGSRLCTVRPCLPLPVTFRAEDSPRGLWRSLGKRVGFTPSRVRIPHPPQLPLGETPLTLIHVPSPLWTLVSVLVSVGSDSGCSVTQMRPPTRAATSRRMGSVTC